MEAINIVTGTRPPSVHCSGPDSGGDVMRIKHGPSFRVLRRAARRIVCILAPGLLADG